MKKVAEVWNEQISGKTYMVNFQWQLDSDICRRVQKSTLLDFPLLNLCICLVLHDYCDSSGLEMLVMFTESSYESFNSDILR
mmetsp:Transcript_4366/g.5641  ORF Transcript_4366/g.5641 Transcript_4366/m.5641 type:complete len:82 (-) Transcript_4366:147-392(-)